MKFEPSEVFHIKEYFKGVIEGSETATLEMCRKFIDTYPNPHKRNAKSIQDIET